MCLSTASRLSKVIPPGASLTRTRVVPVSPRRDRGNPSSSGPGVVSILLPCLSRAPDDSLKVVEDSRDTDAVVVRNSTYHFSEDDDEDTAVTDLRHSTPQHRPSANAPTFQTAGSSELKESGMTFNDLQ